jgi:ArsR family transcriptional regulator
MVSERELERLLKALANKKRIVIMRHLKSGPTTVGEIAKAIKLSIKATSHHLQLLSSAGYVVSEQEGLYVRYAINPQTDHAARILKTTTF